MIYALVHCTFSISNKLIFMFIFIINYFENLRRVRSFLQVKLLSCCVASNVLLFFVVVFFTLSRDCVYVLLMIYFDYPISLKKNVLLSAGSSLNHNRQQLLISRLYLEEQHTASKMLKSLFGRMTRCCFFLVSKCCKQFQPI